MTNSSSTRWLLCGAVSGFLAVALGAFAAHGLEGPLLKLYGGQTKSQLGQEVPAAVKYLGDFKTGADYQLAHSLALLLVALLPAGRCVNVAGWSFLIGIVLFSGSLYALVLTGITKLGMVTPFGGVAFLVGWAALAASALAAKEAT